MDYSISEVALSISEIQRYVLKLPLCYKTSYAIRPQVLGLEKLIRAKVATMTILRRMSGHTKNGKFQNDYIWEKVNVTPIEKKMTKTRL